MALLLFVSCPLSVHASDHGGGGSSSTTRTLIKAHESKENREKVQSFIEQYFTDAWGFFVYAASQVGCVITGQYKDAYDSWLTMEEILESDIGIYVDDNEKFDGFYFSADLMAQIKKLIDDYAAENQPFKVEKTYKLSQIPASAFDKKYAYDYYKSFWGESYTYLVLDPKGSYGFIRDVTPIMKEGGGFVKYQSNIVVYNADWAQAQCTIYKYITNARDENGDFYLKVEESSGHVGYLEHYNPNKTNFSDYYQKPYIVTTDGGNIRVFNTTADFINYSTGQRKIYYTSEYYNYVPEDLQVSIDDLQKTIDDMQDVIDKLLDQITNNTSESEIEELLRLILEELKNNQGGGDGSGGGDVNVDIDLSTTNGILSKILAKVTQISEKISAPAGQFVTDVVNSIEKLGEMLKKYLDRITGDLGDIKDQLEQMTEAEFEEKADSFLNETAGSFSEIGEVAKGKFPFSIPNDMRTLLELLSVPPPAPETAALYSAGSGDIQPLSGDHGGDGATRPPTDGTGSGDHGGGGSTRPPTGGIASVEQGSGGGSFGISESGAPVIRCPIVIKRLGIDYSVKIDLSDFDKVAALSRAFLTLLFIYGLYNLTFKVIGLWGDLAE